MNAEKEIVQFDSASRFAGEHSALVSSLGYLDWALQVQIITQSLGLPMSDELINADTVLAKGSLPNRLGHATVSSFISSDKSKFGLGMEWGKWVELVSAFKSRQSYGIYADSPSDINSELRDVAKYLGHAPANAAEYHRAKDSILLKKHRDARLRHEDTINEMQSRIASLLKSGESDRAYLLKEQQRSSALGDELRAVVQDSERRIEALRGSMQQEKEHELGLQRQEFEVALHAQLEGLRGEHARRTEELNQEMEDIKARYSGENFVTKNEYLVLENEIAMEHRRNREYLAKINQLDEDLNDAMAKISSLGDEVGDKNLRISEYVNMVESMKLRIDELSSLDAPITEGADMNDVISNKIEILNSTLQYYRSQNIVLKKNQETLIQRIGRLKKSLSKKNATIKSMAIALKGERNMTRIMLTIMVISFSAVALTASI